MQSNLFLMGVNEFIKAVNLPHILGFLLSLLQENFTIDLQENIVKNRFSPLSLTKVDLLHLLSFLISYPITQVA